MSYIYLRHIEINDVDLQDGTVELIADSHDWNATIRITQSGNDYEINADDLNGLRDEASVSLSVTELHELASNIQAAIVEAVTE